jgi:hypothetical protein
MYSCHVSFLLHEILCMQKQPRMLILLLSVLNGVLEWVLELGMDFLFFFIEFPKLKMNREA